MPLYLAFCVCMQKFCNDNLMSNHSKTGFSLVSRTVNLYSLQFQQNKFPQFILFVSVKWKCCLNVSTLQESTFFPGRDAHGNIQGNFWLSKFGSEWVPAPDDLDRYVTKTFNSENKISALSPGLSSLLCPTWGNQTSTEQIYYIILL